MCSAIFVVVMLAQVVSAKSPFDTFPQAKPPYYRVQYKGSTQPGELVYTTNYTVWIPEGVSTLRGLIVHQHGCGTGSSRRRF